MPQRTTKLISAVMPEISILRALFSLGSVLSLILFLCICLVGCQGAKTEIVTEPYAGEYESSYRNFSSSPWQGQENFTPPASQSTVISAVGQGASFLGLPAPASSASEVNPAVSHGSGIYNLAGNTSLERDPSVPGPWSGARRANSDSTLDPAHAAMQHGLSMGMGVANSTMERALLALGAGKVRLSYRMDSSGRISGEGDVLLPLYDSEWTTVFFQGGARSMWDDRWIGNFGLGQRWVLSDRMMIGYNAFYDYDFTRGHQRGGIGAELWYDFLRVSSNYYFPLSNWKDSKDLVWHRERPAEGWDVRLKGYLPFYRNIAVTGSLTQWYGDKVGVFGSTKLERDPRVWSYGLEYTPIPLISAFINQKQTERSHTDTEFGVTLTYHFNMPFEDQLKPSKVQEMRTVAESRYEFVDRENRIILEYEEKGLRAEWGLFMWNGREVTLPVSVFSGSPIVHVEWRGTGPASATFQQLTMTSGKFTFPLGDGGPYSFEVIVTNESGHIASTGVRTLSMLGRAFLNLDLISTQTTTPTNTQLPLTYQVTDGYGLPVPDKVVSFEASALNRLGSIDLTARSLATDEDGKVTIGVSGASSGTALVNASLKADDLTLDQKIYIYDYDSSLVAEDWEIKESGQTTLTFTLRSQDGEFIPHEAIIWSVNSNKAILSSATTTTNASGQATVQLRGASLGAGTVKVTAQARSGKGNPDSVDITIIAHNYRLRVNPDTIMATVPQDVTFTLLDGAEIVPNASLNFRNAVIATNPTVTGLPTGPVQTNNEGKFTLSNLTVNSLADNQIMNTLWIYNGHDLDAQIEVHAPSKGAIVFPEDPVLPVGDTTGTRVTYIARNLTTGTPLSNATMFWQVTNGSHTPLSATTDANGIAYATVVPDASGQTVIINASAATQGNLLARTEIQVEGYTPTIKATPASMYANETSTLTFELIRGDNVAAVGEPVTWSINNTTLAALSSNSTTTDTAGRSTIRLTGKGNAGTVTVTATTAKGSATVRVTLKALNYTLSSEPLYIITQVPQAVTLYLEQDGKVAAYREVDLSSIGPATFNGLPARATTDGLGRIFTTLTGVVAGNATVVARVDNQTPQSRLYVVSPTATSTLTPDVASMELGNTALFTFVAKQRATVNGTTYEEAIGNAPVTFHIEEGSGAILSSSKHTDSLGRASAVIQGTSAGKLTVRAELSENRSVGSENFVMVTGQMGYTIRFDKDVYNGVLTSGNVGTVSGMQIKLTDTLGQPVINAQLSFKTVMDDSRNTLISASRRGKFYGMKVRKAGESWFQGGETIPITTARTDANGMVTLDIEDILGDRELRLEVIYTRDGVNYVDTAHVIFGTNPDLGGKFHGPYGPGTWVTAADACGGSGYSPPGTWVAPPSFYVNNSKLPTVNEMHGLMSNRDLINALGWPTNYAYWTGTAVQSNDVSNIIYPNNPTFTDNSGPYNWLYWICIK